MDYTLIATSVIAGIVALDKLGFLPRRNGNNLIKEYMTKDDISDIKESVKNIPDINTNIASINLTIQHERETTKEIIKNLVKRQDEFQDRLKEGENKFAELKEEHDKANGRCNNG